MGEFLNVTLARVPQGLDFSDPLRLLFEWVGDQGYVVAGHDGDLYGRWSAAIVEALGSSFVATPPTKPAPTYARGSTVWTRARPHGCGHS
jgi:hypothetical protein